MAVTEAMLPDLVDPSGFDRILGSDFDPYYAQQLQAWNLPIRPAMARQRRQREDAFQQILAQNADANQMLNALSNRQLDNDVYGMDVDLAKSINQALDPGSKAAINTIGVNQGLISNPEAFDAIVGGSDQSIQGKANAEANKAQAEAESEPLRAAAAMEQAKNGGDGGINWEQEIAPDGSLIGIKYRGKGVMPSNLQGGQSNAQPVNELQSTAGTGRRLIRNSDGSGVLILEDGSKAPVTKENMQKYGF